MSIALQGRIALLEAEVKRLNEVVTGLIEVLTEQAPKNPNGPRDLCPKCNEKPNYFFHVRSCKGPSKTAAL